MISLSEYDRSQKIVLNYTKGTSFVTLLCLSRGKMDIVQLEKIQYVNGYLSLQFSRQQIQTKCTKGVCLKVPSHTQGKVPFSTFFRE